jgi:energy-coupling factor transport system permease protein
VPILEDALDRSLALAASMDSRGYGRAGPRSKSSVRVAGGLLVLGLCALTVGVYALLDGTAPRVLAGPMLVAGAGVGAVAMSLAGRGLQRTAYRPDRWGLSELLVVASGLTATALVYVGLQADPAAVVPSLSPLAWPELAPLPLAGVLVGLAPAWVAPTPALPEAAS